MTLDAAYYNRAVRRIYRFVAAFGVIGTAGTAVLLDWRAGLGFFLGAVGSGLNFRWLHRLMDSFGEGGRKMTKALAFFLMSRYLLFGAAAYVIVKFFDINLVAVLAGLLVAVAAVIFEILYELTYART